MPLAMDAIGDGCARRWIPVVLWGPEPAPFSYQSHAGVLKLINTAYNVAIIHINIIYVYIYICIRAHAQTLNASTLQLACRIH